MKKSLLAFALFTVVCFSNLAAQSAIQDSPVIPEYLRQAILDEDYATSLEQIRIFQRRDDDPTGFWYYLEASLVQRDGRSDKALELYREFVDAQPESPWLHKARFQQASIYATQGKWNRAEKIWAEEVSRLRGPERQRALAKIYLDLAAEKTAPLTGARIRVADDFQQARLLYVKSMDLDLPSDLRKTVLERIAWCSTQASDWHQATRDYAIYLGEFDDAEVMYDFGEAQRKAGQGEAARRTLEDLAANIAAGDYELKESAGDDLRGLAMYSSAYTYGNSQKDSMGAIGAFHRFLEEYPLHVKGSRAAFGIAQHWERWGHHKQAIDAYEKLLMRAAPSSTEMQELEHDAKLRMESQFNIGDQWMQLGDFISARKAYALYVELYSEGPSRSQAQRNMVQAEYRQCKALEKEYQWQQAREAYLAFLQQHPLDARADNILFALGALYQSEANLLKGDASREAREKLFQSAISEWSSVIQRLPNSDQASQALFETGKIQEMEFLQLEEAVASYRACNFGSFSWQAKEQLDAMLEDSMLVFTQQTWRRDETASFTLEVRNLESVKVEVYRLNLEAYFRKHLTHNGIQNLDLDLIAADMEFEQKVEGYTPYQPFTLQVDLPVKGVGVWAVAVSSDTQRATTLVLRSDLDVLVRSSKEEAIVFVEDMRIMQPAEGVQVIMAVPDVAGGDARMVEFVTGPDGVVRIDFEAEEIRNPDNLRIFTLDDRGVASTELPLRGLDISTTLNSTGFAYTERSAYLPGSKVSWRALLREVENGSFQFEVGEEQRIVVTDPSGRVLVRETQMLNEFGTVSGEFRLSVGAPLGRYTLSCKGPRAASATTYFEVQKFLLKPLQIDLECDRAVYYRGERVLLNGQLAWNYGEPLAGAKIQLQTPDGRMHNLISDGEGRFEIDFDTQGMSSGEQLQFHVLAMEEDVYAGINVLLADRGYSIQAKVKQALGLVGEEVEISFTTSAPDGELVARKMMATLLLRERQANGYWSDVEVESFEIETDDSGRVIRLLKPTRGGDYTLRVRGEDRFGTPVLATVSFFLSGEDDQQKLRLFADLDALDVGAKMPFKVMNRAGEGLALMTFEGGGILEYRILEMAEGLTEFEEEVPHEFFPEVTVSIAMMSENHFFESQKAFRVKRQLEVRVLPRKEVVRPGEDVVVDLEVVDQNGAPVHGEFSFAVVDQAVFAQFPDRASSIVEVFANNLRRSSQMRSTSSNVFFYKGVTWDIDQALLDEDERRLAEEAWANERVLAVDELNLLAEREAPSAVSKAAPPRFASEELMELGYADGADMSTGAAYDSDSWDNDIGLGGGAGGKYGGRGGLRRQGSSDANNWFGQDETESLDRMTSVWLPHVVTDLDGKATLKFVAPQQSTKWRLMCRGTDVSTSVGQGEATLITHADFFLEARTPTHLLEGDRASVMVRLHNLTGMKGSAEVRLSLAYPGRVQEVSAVLDFSGNTIAEVFLRLNDPVPSGWNEAVAMKIVALGEFKASTDHDHIVKLRSSLVRNVLVQPWGLPVTVQDSGILSDQKDIRLMLPKGTQYSAAHWELQLGVGLDQLLIQEALGVEGVRPIMHAEITTDLLGVLSVLQHLRDTDQMDVAPYSQLKERASGLLTQLLALQKDDGGWAWSGRNGKSNADVSAMAMLSLEVASLARLDVPGGALASGRNYLMQAIGRSDKHQTERRARLLYALSFSGGADFSFANSLHRDRERLSAVACAYAARALVRMKSVPMAREVIQVMLKKLARGKDVRGFSMQCQPMEQIALALSAVLEVNPGDEAVEGLERQLLAGRPWYGSGARGLALAALAQHRTMTGLHDRDVIVKLQVGNGKEHTVRLDANQSSFSLRDMLGEDLVRPEVRLRLRLQGKGAPHYRFSLEGFDTNPQRTRNGELSIAREGFLAPRPMYAGREVEVGFNRLRSSRNRWENLLENLSFADVTPARVDFSRHYDANESMDSLDYLMLEIPLPAGAQLLDDSVQGSFLSWRLVDGVLLVDVGQHRGSGMVRYRLRGLQPGTYRTLPPVLRSVYRPDRFAIGKAHTLTVLGRGEVSTDPYRPTPDELFGIGMAAYQAEDSETAWRNLTALVDDYDARLRPAEQNEVARALLSLSIERQDANRIVQVFETLKEKDPNLSVSFDRLTKIAQAYRQLGESERAARIYRAVAETTFSKDLQLVGVLEQQHDFHAASEAMYRFWLEYPNFPTVIETGVTLADRLLQAAPNAHKDRSLRVAKRNRAVLLFESVIFLQRFLALHPQEPVSADAALNLVSALLDIEDYESAAHLAEEFSGRFTKPKFADAFLYTQAVAEWYQGHDAEAVALLQTIAEVRYANANGGVRFSRNRNLAIYILAQIHHARQDFKDAATYYEQVSQVFVDAREVLADFRRRALSLDEVTEIAPGEVAKLELHYRNLTETELLVYPVDLMTLYLREKNLSGITQVNLAGIEPVIRRTVALPDDQSMRQQDFELELELPGAGAYLIICRSDAIHASGMVLVSDFELVVETDPQRGGVRAQAIARADGKYLRDVDIRVIGTQNQGFHSGNTDPRGLYVATGVHGAATVIARHDGRHYAFFRGEKTQQEISREAGLKIEMGQRLDSESYLDNVRSLNSSQQLKRSKKLEKQQKQDYRGLELNSLE